MPSLQPTEDWSQSSYTPLQSATRVFIAPGYATGTQAISAVIGYFGVRPGSQHPEDAYMFVTLGGTTARRKDGPTTWEVVISYMYLAQSIATGQDAEPLLRPTVWDINSGLDSETIDRDAAGFALTNSAGTPLQTNRTFNTLHIRALRYYTNYDLSLALKYMNKTNSSPIQLKTLGSLPPKSIKCELISPNSQIILNQPSPIAVVHEFEVRGSLVTGDPNDPSFAARFLDKGTSGWYRDIGTDTSITVRPGDFSSRDPDPGAGGRYRYRNEETLLGGDGRPLDQNIKIGEGLSPKDPYGVPFGLSATRVKVDGAVFLLYDKYPTIDFGPLIAGL